MSRSLLVAVSALLLQGAASKCLTCKDVDSTGKTCMTPTVFPNTTTVGGVQIPTAWDGPAPVCFAQYFQNQCVSVRQAW